MSRMKPVILMVEDSRMDIRLARDAFRTAGIDTDLRVFNDGLRALAYMFGEGEYADRDAHPLPDLVLVDLKMPSIDGPEIVRRLKRAEGVRKVPVVVMTSSKEHHDLTRCYENGANSYLVKPVSFVDFVELIKGLHRYWFVLNQGPPGPRE